MANPRLDSYVVEKLEPEVERVVGRRRLAASFHPVNHPLFPGLHAVQIHSPSRLVRVALLLHTDSAGPFMNALDDFVKDQAILCLAPSNAGVVGLTGSSS